MVVPEKFFDIEFNKAMAFGYRTEDVDEFVTKAIEIIKALQEENQELAEKMGILAESLEKYREDEESLRSALIGAQKLGDSILKDSRSKAEVILRDATTQADHIIEEAHARLERERAEYERLKAEVATFREGLFDMYKSPIDQSTRLPHKEKAQQKAQPKAAPPQEPEAPPPPPPPPEPEEPPVKKAEPEPAPRKTRRRPEPEPELEDEEEFAEPPAPPVKKAPPKRPALRLELEEDDEDDDEELEDDDVILSRFSSRFGRRPVRQELEDDDFEDDEDDEDDEEDFAPARTVISSKFGEMRFGEGFNLQEEREKGSGGRSRRR